MARQPDAVDAALRTVFGGRVPVSCQRTTEGVSTRVYRIRRGPETYYLRVAEEADDNLETDADLHERLLDAGVRVPRVVHVEAFNAGIGRSIMITAEVPGEPLAENSTPAVAASIAEQAGADLAFLNQTPVDGFGWIRRRGRRWPPEAEHAGYPPFLTSYLPRPWPGVLTALLPTPVLDTIDEMIEYECRRSPPPARLAHGDFDTTQIFCAAGRYTGLIDFGEIRGTEPLFDLGHFHLYDGQDGRPVLLPALLRGYRRVHDLPADHEQAIRRSATLLALRQLCRWIGPLRRPLDHPAVTHRAQRIADLATGA